MTDASENVVNHYAYSPYGLVLNQTEGVENRFQYVGSMGVMDEHDGLMFMRARYYDSLSRRFISTDPIAYDGSFISRYAYVQGNPAIRVDPNGDVWLQVAGALVGAGLNAYNNWDAWQSGSMSNSQFAASVALGAATGVLSTLGGASFIASAAAGGVSAAANSAGNQALAGGSISIQKTVTAGAVGAASGFATAALSQIGKNFIRYNIDDFIAPSNYQGAAGWVGFTAGTVATSGTGK